MKELVAPLLVGILIGWGLTYGEMSEDLAVAHTAVKARNTVINSLNGDVELMRKAISDNNKVIDGIVKTSKADSDKAKASIAALLQDAKARQLQIDLLKKVSPVKVDSSKMTSAQIEAELGDCRRSVNINNDFIPGELL